MHDVFISYNSKDAVVAKKVRDFLEKNAIGCWMAPESLSGGSNYTKEIPKAIRECRVFVLILSDDAQKSIYVPKELDLAVKYEKKIIPYMVEQVQLSDQFEFLLTQVQFFDASHSVASMKSMAESIYSYCEIPKQEMLENKVRTAYVQRINCPICDSSQVTRCKRISVLVGKQEKKIFGKASVIGGIVGFSLPFLGIGYAKESGINPPAYMVFLLIIGVVLGVRLGKRYTEAPLRRYRELQKRHPFPFKCEMCGSVFLKPEENFEF